MAGVPRRVLTLVAPVSAAGVFTVAAAFAAFAASTPNVATLLGVAALLAASLFAERYPVPLDGIDAGGVSVAFVFGLGTIVLFGWAPGVLVCFAAPALTQALEHRPPIRVAFNASALALAAATTGAVMALVPGEGAAALAVRVALGGTVQVIANIFLVSSAISLTSRRPLVPLVSATLRVTGVAFTIMTSTTLVLAVLWGVQPLLASALVGPLLAIALYQRSDFLALRAMRLALTDPLTGLGNHRHFDERLRDELQNAAATDASLGLCLLDLDDFKHINDRFGHPAGDRLLVQVAETLRRDGQTFRLGGDEFAILFPASGEDEALEAARSIVNRITELRTDERGPVTVSAGVACFPHQASDREELVRLADSALYWAKEHGKNRVRVYRPALVEFDELRSLAEEPDAPSRFRAAASLARAVDARDTYTGNHSQRVAILAAGLAERLELDKDEVSLVRLAAGLHDLGKLAIPEDILRKPGPLDETERAVLERHPQLGFRMLEGLNIDPVARWVLHHHERWDGCGYPDGLAGTQIPLGARIILVADAFDALTSDRVYRRRLRPADALAEVRRCAGTQFDPVVVTALAEELGVEEQPIERFELKLAAAV